MAMARRVSLFERVVSVKLSAFALDILYDASSKLTEGDLDGNNYQGSTMVTVDLSNTVTRMSDPADAATARRVASLYPADERARARARRLAIGEANRIAGTAIDHHVVDVRARSVGAKIHLDLDLEAQRAVVETRRIP